MSQQETTFVPEDFLQKYYSKGGGNVQQHLQSCQQRWACQAFDIIPQVDFCLELGCGPVLNLAACASRRCRNIYLSEYNLECFNAIKKELERDPSEKSFWSENYKVIAKIESNTADEVEYRLKERIVACLKCDLNRDQILVGISYFKKMDVIVSSLTIESVVKDIQQYERTIRNIKKLLKTHGYLYLFGVLEETYYIVKDKMLPSFPLTEKTVKQTLKNCGFEIIKFNSMKNPNPKPISDNKGFFSVLAKSIQ